MNRTFWLKALLVVVALSGIAYGVYYFDRRNDGFTVEKITSVFPNDPRWDIQVTSPQIRKANEILSQPFFYLGHGFQCYAFISQDGQYVLKFLRHQRLRPPVLYDWLPNLPFVRKLKNAKTEQRQKRADALFQALKVSFEDVPHETGLLFVHINKTKGLHPTVSIHDKVGTNHLIAVDEYEFVLQLKAKHVKPVLCRLMKTGDVEGAKARIDQIFSLLSDCAKKGICDMDGALIYKNNLGFLKDRAIYIDTGKLTRKPIMRTKERFTQDLRRLKPLYKWLMQHYPVLANHFEKAEQHAIDTF